MPRYENSEIFENFVKIASEKGLVSKAEKFKPHENRSPKEIADLHGVKPDMIPGMKYDKNILEVSHPESFVVLPTHDKMNGLVENISERHNILVNLVKQRTTGNISTRKLAHNELVKSLIRVANDLDNRDKDELRVLADACIEGLTKEADFTDSIKDFFKEHTDDVTETGKGVAGGAVVGGLIGGILGGIFGVGAGALPGALLGAKVGGVAGGLVAAVAKTSPQARSVAVNAQDTINQLNDLVQKFPNNALLVDLHKQLETLKTYAEQFSNLSNNPNQNGNSNLAEELTKKYVAQMEKVKLDAATFKGKASQGDFAEQEDSLISKLKTPLHWFMDDDVDDVKDSLDALTRAINAAEAGIAQLKTATQTAMVQVEAGKSEVKKPEEEKFDADKELDDWKSYQKMYDNMMKNNQK